MSGKVFLDSNIWLYALIAAQNENDMGKHSIAKQLISPQHHIQTSTQVVNEVCINLMRKAQKDSHYILQFSRDLISNYPVHSQTPKDIISAATLRLDYQLSYWDSLIVASALHCECSILYSEDMQHELRVYNKLRIINPFV